ncbi:MAG: twin-arginine translocase TatA/TatE family subunit [Peptococcaceae bacterium]|nr:twin-arginine translocase TatA/TatE family subunit [Peptococcaceae bacterium]
MDFPEMGFLVVLALILFGPDELPNIARKLGGIIHEVKKVTQDVQQEVRKSVLEADLRNMATQTKPAPVDNTPTVPTEEVEAEIVDFAHSEEAPVAKDEN